MKKGLLAGACALLLSGCGSTTTSIGNLIAFNSPKAPAPVDMTKPAPDKVDCPIVDIVEGGSSFQVGSGQALRHQFTFSDLSRECTVDNKQIAIRVGVAGRLIAGPAGGPGTVSAPVRVSIRSETSGAVLTFKDYTVSATIPATASNATFAIVTDPLTVPFLREEAYEDYIVMVSFGKK